MHHLAASIENLLIILKTNYMKINFNFCLLLIAMCATIIACKPVSKNNSKNRILLKNVTLIDGNGGPAVDRTDILIQGDTITAIGKDLDSTGLKVIHLEGKTVMPALISAHVHVGTLKGTSTKSENYTRANILSQLKKYQDYGVTNILVMGTDRPLLFERGLRDSSAKGRLPGARIYTAGYGFGVPQGAPPVNFAMDKVYRPAAADQVAKQMDSLRKLNPTVVKIWVDDFGGTVEKMDPAIYKAIIDQAHRRKLRVAAHAYYLSDARKLVEDGIDIIAHSIRDTVLDAAFIQQMKAKKVAYIPTLSLDEFAYIYGRKPDWINDPFFKNSLEPGVYELITSSKYQQDLKNAPNYTKNIAAFETALKNLKKLFDAGVVVAMGTDSGAMPLRAQGFSEHLEMELLVQAGLTPLQAITVATKNSAEVLKINSKFGTLAKGKMADLIILNANPVLDIKHTRQIEAVYKAGKEVSKGPLVK